MNKTYNLLKYFYQITKIPIHYISSTDDVILFSMGYPSTAANPFYCDKELRHKLYKHVENNDNPILDTEFSSIIYASFSDFMGNFVILGPVSLHQCNHELISQYTKKHLLENSRFTLLFVQSETFSAGLCSIFYMINGTLLEQSQIDLFSSSEMNLPDDQSKIQTYILDNSENDIQRFSYREEQKIMNIIQSGDIKAVKHKVSIEDLAFQDKMVGRMAEMPLKNIEYTVCSSISLMTRAAIEGGLDPISAYSMSDIYLQRLACCNDFKSIAQLQLEAKIAFVQAVHNSKLQIRKSSYVEQCKNYITNHLNKPFTLNDIAQEIGLNKTYLSKKFNDIEQIHIFEYAQKKRISAAKNMLKYSNNSISSISDYLCFSSQSHFSSVFKKHTGLTPKQYRDKEKIIDFS